MSLGDVPELRDADAARRVDTSIRASASAQFALIPALASSERVMSTQSAASVSPKRANTESAPDWLPCLALYAVGANLRLRSPLPTSPYNRVVRPRDAKDTRGEADQSRLLSKDSGNLGFVRSLLSRRRTTLGASGSLAGLVVELGVLRTDATVRRRRRLADPKFQLRDRVRVDVAAGIVPVHLAVVVVLGHLFFGRSGAGSSQAEVGHQSAVSAPLACLSPPMALSSSPNLTAVREPPTKLAIRAVLRTATSRGRSSNSLGAWRTSFRMSSVEAIL